MIKIMRLKKHTKNAVASGNMLFTSQTLKILRFPEDKKGLIVKRPFPFFFFCNFLSEMLKASSGLIIFEANQETPSSQKRTKMLCIKGLVTKTTWKFNAHRKWLRKQIHSGRWTTSSEQIHCQ